MSQHGSSAAEHIGLGSGAEWRRSALSVTSPSLLQGESAHKRTSGKAVKKILPREFPVIERDDGRAYVMGSLVRLTITQSIGMQMREYLPRETGASIDNMGYSPRKRLLHSSSRISSSTSTLSSKYWSSRSLDASYLRPG